MKKNLLTLVVLFVFGGAVGFISFKTGQKQGALATCENAKQGITNMGTNFGLQLVPFTCVMKGDEAVYQFTSPRDGLIHEIGLDLKDR